MPANRIRSRQVLKQVKRVASSLVTQRLAVIRSINPATGRATILLEGTSNPTPNIPFPGGGGGLPAWVKPGVPVVVQGFANSPVGLQITGESSVQVSGFSGDTSAAIIPVTGDGIASGFVPIPYAAWWDIGVHGGIAVGSAGAGGGNSYILQGNIQVFGGLLLGSSCDIQSGGVGFCRNNQGADSSLGNGIGLVGEVGYFDQTFTVLRVPPVSASGLHRVDMVTLKVTNPTINGMQAPVAKLTLGTEVSDSAVPPLPSPLFGEYLLGYVVVHSGCKDFASAINDSTIAKQNFIPAALIRVASGGVVGSFTVPSLTTYPALTLTPVASYGTQLTGSGRTVKATLDFGPSAAGKALACYLSNNLAFNRASTDADPWGGVAVTTQGVYQREVDCVAAVQDTDTHWKTNFYFDVPAQGIGASKGFVNYGFVGGSGIPDYTNMVFRTQTVYWGD